MATNPTPLTAVPIARETEGVLARGFVGRASLGHFTGHRGDGQLVLVLIEDEFQAADVTAVHAFRLGQAAVVRDLGLAGRTLPRHREGNRLGRAAKPARPISVDERATECC